MKAYMIRNANIKEKGELHDKNKCKKQYKIHYP